MKLVFILKYSLYYMYVKIWQDRVKELIKKHKTSQEAIAEKIGVTQSSIGHWINRRRQPSFGHIEALAKVFGVSTQWLLYGDDSSLSKIRGAIAQTVELPIIQWSDFEGVNNPSSISLVHILNKRRMEGKVLRMYLIGNETLGVNVGAIQAENLDAMLPHFTDKKAIFDGDWLIFDCDKEPYHGCRVLVSTPHGITVRQYVKDGDKGLLKALNPQYPIIEDFTVLGVLIKQVREE